MSYVCVPVVLWLQSALWRHAHDAMGPVLIEPINLMYDMAAVVWCLHSVYGLFDPATSFLNECVWGKFDCKLYDTYVGMETRSHKPPENSKRFVVRYVPVSCGTSWWWRFPTERVNLDGVFACLFAPLEQYHFSLVCIVNPDRKFHVGSIPKWDYLILWNKPNTWLVCVTDCVGVSGVQNVPLSACPRGEVYFISPEKAKGFLIFSTTILKNFKGS